jgi:hypothetical protein
MRTSSVANWLHSGDLPYHPGVETRSFIDPPSQGSHAASPCTQTAGQPDTYQGTNWSNTAALGCDQGGIHGNGGVQNHWFYLLSQEGSGTNDNLDFYNVLGIGADDAAEIAFWSMQNELTDAANYNDARSGAIAAAIMLFGNCSVQHWQTDEAWYAVGVGNGNACPGLNVSEYSDENFSIYLNPAESFISLDWKNKSNFNVAVYDVTEKVIVKKENVNSNMVFDIQSGSVALTSSRFKNTISNSLLSS